MQVLLRTASPLLLALGLVASAAVHADEALWAKLKEGRYTVFIRHALAPGTADPQGFTLEDCATQRNLSAQGHEQARRIGEAFRSRGIPVGEVRSSRWCRCLDTATSAFGRVEPWSALNSNFNDPFQKDEDKNRRVLAELTGAPPKGGNRILVTHNVNIRDLTGMGPGSGEMVIVEPDGSGSLRVLGRIPAAR
jgi:phosphohistidine phosphatase SixA